MHQLPLEVHELIKLALQEDQAFNDPTTESLIDKKLKVDVNLVAKQSGIIAGIEVFIAVLGYIDTDLKFQRLIQDGEEVKQNDTILKFNGSAYSILRGERTALNFIQRMSGIASQTRAYVNIIEDLNATIVDTRKTLPGHRFLDKYSIVQGGGRNHRFNLADGILIKDNHLVALSALGLNNTDAVTLAIKNSSHTINVEIETETIEEVRSALFAGAQIIMLDNMDVDTMREAVKLINGKAIVEASGGINLSTVRSVAETGVDLISVGSLTHSVQGLDISLDIKK
ncbi:MAG TPA: carboxylating nicotinate-nucleotide diphosphorylase [Dehalococcoidia bacterium]|nr:carboxylating nicotinate-nucleotide diphosphorylase [Dehalococcoidia bacterium]